MQEYLEMLTGLDWSPLFITLKTAVAATAVAFVIGILVAYAVMKSSSKLKAVIDGLLTLPMVLPPTVAGFVLLLLFSRRRPLGMWLEGTLDIQIVQTWAGCVIAAFVIAFPLMYRSARAAFEQMDINLVHAGCTLGMSEFKIFRRIIIPTAGPGIASGTILTFARAMGEYGATTMLAGNIAGKTATISQQIAVVMKDGDYATAGVWVVIILLISFVILFLMNYVVGKNLKNIKRW